MGFDTSRPAYRKALILQDALIEEVQKPDCPGSVKAQSARAYCELEKLKRIMRGLPANTSQSIREPKESRRKKSVQAIPLEVLPAKGNPADWAEPQG